MPRKPAAGQGESDLVRLREAAQLLGVSAETLCVWEAAFGYPHAEAAPTGERWYVRDQVHALRRALARELSIPAAIRSARALAPARLHADDCGRPASDARS